MKENSKKIIISGGIVLAIILVVSIGTYAWITWTSSNVSITGTSECFDINYVKGKDIGSDDNPAEFTVGSSYTDGLSSSLKVNISSSCSINKGTGTLYLNTDTSVTSEVLLGTGVLKYQVCLGNETSTLTSCTSLGSGTVTSGIEGVLVLADDIEITDEVKEITVYLWIDKNNITSTNGNDVLASSYKGYISFEAEMSDV